MTSAEQILQLFVYKKATTKKFIRAPNFSFEDEYKFLDSVEKYTSIIECKKSDSVTWKEKERAWQRVANDFNASTLRSRTLKELQLKYKCLKKAAKKEAGRRLQSLRGTGGGPPYEPPRNSTILERILKLIPLAATGLPALTDSDVLAAPEEVESQDSAADEPDEEDLINDSDNESQDIEMVLSVHDSQPGCSGLQSATVIAEGTEGNWGNYTPARLRRPKHPALKISSAADQCASLQKETEVALGNKGASSSSSRRRPALVQRDTVASASTKKYSLLAVAKTALANEQKDLLVKQHEAAEARNAAEHELRLKMMSAALRLTEAQIKNEEADFKIKKLKIQALEKLGQSN